MVLKNYQKVLIAFSGGVDSTFLLYVAWQTLGRDNVLAVIAESPTYPAEESFAAQQFCAAHAINYQVVQTDEFSDANFVNNPKERCYYCKKELFSKLVALVKENHIPYVLDGSNADDRHDFRPGNRAKEELGVQSPLLAVGFTKQQIRECSKSLNLPTWDKAALACLASRIPYGTRITSEILHKIGEGERFLKNLGLRQLRVRHHDAIARIEVTENDFSLVLQEETREEIQQYFQKLGYFYVALDLKGYRTGSMNEVLELT